MCEIGSWAKSSVSIRANQRRRDSECAFGQQVIRHPMRKESTDRSERSPEIARVRERGKGEIASALFFPSDQYEPFLSHPQRKALITNSHLSLQLLSDFQIQAIHPIHPHPHHIPHSSISSPLSGRPKRTHRHIILCLGLHRPFLRAQRRRRMMTRGRSVRLRLLLPTPIDRVMTTTTTTTRLLMSLIRPIP